VFFTVVALLVSAMGMASSTVGIGNFTISNAAIGGNIDVYDYASGVTRTSDTGVDWDGGYNNTEKTSDGASVTLSRYGDVAPDILTNPWWSLTYKTRRCFLVTNANTWAVSNLPVELTFDAVSDQVSGWMATDGSDIRVLTGGATPAAVPFFVTGPFSTTAGTISSVTAQVPALAAGASMSLCLYSNKSGAAAGSASVTTAKDSPSIFRYAAGVTVAGAPSLPSPLLPWTTDVGLGTVAPTLGSAAMSFPPVPGIPASPPAGLPGTANLAGVSPAASTLDVSVPPGTPLGIFANVRWPGPNNGSTLYSFNVGANRPVVVRGYFAENCCSNRIFNFQVNGANVPNPGVGAPTYLWVHGVCPITRCGVMRSAAVTAPVSGIVTTSAVRLPFPLAPGFGDNNPIINAVEVVDKTVLTVGPTRREGITPSTGSWTSPVYTNTSAAKVFGLLSPSLSGPSLAINKPVTSLSLAATSNINAGNDARRNGQFFTSNAGAGQWWQVDLGSSQPIGRINAYTSAGAMSDISILVSNAPLSTYTSAAAAAAGAGVLSSSFPGASGLVLSYSLPAGSTGRYVRLWSGSAAAISFGEVDVLSPVATGVSMQYRSTASVGGTLSPWFGPDGTAATSYTAKGPFPYLLDGQAQYQVRANFSTPNQMSSPSLDAVSTNADLTIIPRSADGYHQVNVPDLGDNWLVRVKTTLAATVGKSATLNQINPGPYGLAQVSGYLDRISAQCCSANAPFFTTVSPAPVTSQTPVPLYDVSGSRNLSVIVNRSNAVVALYEQVVDIALSTTVRLQIPLRRNAVPANLALNQPSSQSTTDFAGLASLANDGNTNGQYYGPPPSVNHTAQEIYPWWQVDVGSVRSLTSIEVWPRTDCCTARLTNFTLIVSPTPIVATTLAAAASTPGVVTMTYANPAGFSSPQYFTLPGGTTGRYVRLWADNSNTAIHPAIGEYFHVAEVLIIGPT
jgi:F5/8 type C domain